MSVIVNQYNNTAITTSSTIRGNVDSLNASTLTQTESLVKLLNAGFFQGDLQYGSTSVGIGNPTHGKVDGSVTIPYPTPYLAIDGFQYVSVTDRVHGCPPGQLKASNDTCTCIMDTLDFAFVGQHVGYPLQGWGPGGEVYPSQTSVAVSLTSTYYETLDFLTVNASNVIGGMNPDTGTINSASFMKFLSAASVFKSHPDLASCSLYSLFNGPPAGLLPAAALTATVSTTIANTGNYNVPTAKPASPVKVTTVPQTAEAPSPTPTIPAAQVPGPKDPTPTPTILPQPPKGTEVPSSNSPEAPGNNHNLPGVQPVAGSSAVAGEQATPVQETSVLDQGGPNPPQSVPILTFDGSTYQADQVSHFIIASQTLTPGGKITISGTPVAIDKDASAAIIGTSTQSLSKAGVTQKPLLVFAGTTYTADDSTHFVIDGNTLTKGGAINIDKTQLSLDNAGTGVVIGTSTQQLGYPGTTVAAKPVLTFGGSTYTADSSSDFIIKGQTLTKDGTVVIDGTTVSYDEADAAVVIGSSTQRLSFAGITPAAEPILTFDGSTYTANPSSNFIIDGQTLDKGDVITIKGTQISYDEAGTAVEIGTSIQSLSHATITAAAEPVLTFDGSTYTANPSSNFVIDGQTLTKGGAITIHGTPLFYDQAGTDVVIGTSTQLLRTTNVAAASDPTITFDGTTYYADASSDFIIDGQTLTRGGVTTINGTPISYAAAGTDVVVGTSTEAVGGLGGYIMSGFGGGGSGPSATGVQPAQFTGRAGSRVKVSWGFVLGAMVVCFGLE